jgi:hypothetical protein
MNLSEAEQKLRIIPVGAVMGNFPDALELAEQTHSGAYAVPERLWRFFSNSGDQWTNISAFWRAIARKRASILLASNPALISGSSAFSMELDCLRSLGFLADPTGTRLDFGRGFQPGAIAAANSPQPSSGVLSSLVRKLLLQPSPTARMRRCLTPGGSDPKFEEAVREELSFLFQKSSAAIDSNHKYPAACGNAIAIVTTSTLAVRVVRDRDEFRIDVAPAHAPTDWKLLIASAIAVSGDAQNAAIDSYTSLSRGAQQLQDSWDQLGAAFSQERYSATANIIKQVEHAKRRNWASTFSPPASGE